MRYTVAVTVEVDDSWADPWNLAQHLVEIAISGDRRGISLPFKIEHATSSVDEDDMDGSGDIVAIQGLGAALQNGTIQIVTAQKKAD